MKRIEEEIGLHRVSNPDPLFARYAILKVGDRYRQQLRMHAWKQGFRFSVKCNQYKKDAIRFKPAICNQYLTKKG
jgi:hypothetical protein